MKIIIDTDDKNFKIMTIDMSELTSQEKEVLLADKEEMEFFEKVKNFCIENGIENIGSTLSEYGVVEESRKKIDDLEDKISELENELSELENKISELESEIQGLHEEAAGADL